MRGHLTDKEISMYVDGLTCPERVGLVQDHVAQCDRCAGRLAQFTLLDETLAWMDPQEMDDAVLRQVRTNVLREVTRRQQESSRIQTPWWVGLLCVRALTYAGAVLLLVCVVGLLLTNPSDELRITGVGREIARVPDVAGTGMQEVAAASQREFYELAAGFLSTAAKKAYDSASDEARTLGHGSQIIVVEKFDRISERSSLVLVNARARASGLKEAVEEHGSRALDAAAKHALPQAGIAAGATLIQLLGTFG